MLSWSRGTLQISRAVSRGAGSGLIQALKQQLNIQLFYVILWPLSALPDTRSVFWRRVGVPNTKHSHSRLFQVPLPTLDEIRGIEMPIVDSCGLLNYQILKSNIMRPRFS